MFFKTSGMPQSRMYFILNQLLLLQNYKPRHESLILVLGPSSTYLLYELRMNSESLPRPVIFKY